MASFAMGSAVREIALLHSKKIDNIECLEYDSFELLESVQLQWDDCVRRNHAEIYLTFDWAKIWWKYYGQGRKLRLFVFTADQRIVGVVPLFSETIWMPLPLHVIKFVAMDYTTSYFRPAVEKSCWASVFQYVLECLATEFPGFVFHFGPLTSWMEELDLFRETLRGILPKGVKIQEKQIGVQTCFCMKPTVEEYISTLPKKTQHELRRKGRVLEELLGEDRLTVHLASQEQVPEMFEQFYLAHQEHWQKQRRQGHFGDWPRSKEFHRELALKQAELNRLRLLELRYGQVILGYKYAYFFGNRWVEILDARNDAESLSRAGLGNILFMEQLKLAIQEGAVEIDSKAGQYEHKKRLGGQAKPIYGLFLTDKARFSRIRFGVDRLVIRLLHGVYYKLWYTKFAMKFKSRRASLWKCWIKTNMFR